MSPKRPWLVLGILCIGFFMALLDGSIVTIAIPTLIGSIGASYDQVLWIIDAYLLVFSVLLITTGRLGDIVGYKRLFLVGVSTFTVASALCGLADWPVKLLGARVLQGVGAAILFPQVISSILAVFPPQQRGRAFGVFGAIAGFAPIAGPIVGGFVLAQFGWRWIFLVNVPIGVLTVVLAVVFVPDLRAGHRHGLDLVGVGLATAGLGGIVFGLIEGERLGWGTSVTVSIVAGVVLVVLFVGWQRVQRREPLMPLELFTAERNFPVGLVVLVLTARPDSGAWQLVPGLLIVGVASGATFAPLQQVTMAGVGPRLAGAASGVAGTTRQVGGVLGTAVLGAVLSSSVSSALRREADERAGLLPAELRALFVESTVAGGRRFGPPSAPAGLPDAALFERLGHEAFAAAYVAAMQVTLLVSAAALVVAALLCSGLETVRSPSRA